MSRRSQAKNRATPGCNCAKCQRAIQEWLAKRGPDPNNNMGRVQHGAREKGWAMGSGEEGEGGYTRIVERSDKEERQVYGRPLTAGYRPLLGPTPVCKSGDLAMARTFLNKILVAMDVGGWTKSEWARLYRMKDKWQARALGKDERFNHQGNDRNTLTIEQKFTRSADQIVKREMRRFHSNGD